MCMVHVVTMACSLQPGNILHYYVRKHIHGLDIR